MYHSGRSWYVMNAFSPDHCKLSLAVHQEASPELAVAFWFQDRHRALESPLFCPSLILPFPTSCLISFRVGAWEINEQEEMNKWGSSSVRVQEGFFSPLPSLWVG